MQTNDIVKRGISRNFIRECERQCIIIPVRLDGKMIVDEKYHRREYSENDLSLIWMAYLLRKVGFSFAEIKQRIGGKNIDLSDYINESIAKYEQQIEELQVTIDFMKCVRGLGFIPEPPKELNEVSNFKAFLQKYMQSIGVDKTKIKYLDDVHKQLELIKIPENKRTVSEKNELRKIENRQDKLINNFSYNTDSVKFLEFANAFSSCITKLIEAKYDIYCNEVQDSVRMAFTKFKDYVNNSELKPVQFAITMCKIFLRKDDMTELLIIKCGKENINCVCNAALEFARINDEEAYNLYLEKLLKNDI